MTDEPVSEQPNKEEGDHSASAISDEWAAGRRRKRLSTRQSQPDEGAATRDSPRRVAAPGRASLGARGTGRVSSRVGSRWFWRPRRELAGGVIGTLFVIA